MLSISVDLQNNARIFVLILWSLRPKAIALIAFVDFFEEHVIGAGVERAVAVETAVDHELFAGFGMGSDTLDNIIVALVVSIDTMNL